MREAMSKERQTSSNRVRALMRWFALTLAVVQVIGCGVGSGGREYKNAIGCVFTEQGTDCTNGGPGRHSSGDVVEAPSIMSEGNFYGTSEAELVEVREVLFR